MRQLRIRKGTIGLVFKNGDYVRFLDAGKHWLGFGESAKIFSLFGQFSPSYELDLLLADKKLANRLHIVEVGDHEVVIQYENDKFLTVLPTGRYTFWKGGINYRFEKINLTETSEIKDLNKALLQKSKILALTRVFEVESYEQALLFINGKYERTLGSGIYRFWRNATPISIQKIDTRQQQLEVAGQEILTKDKAALRINFYIHYKVVDIKTALMENKAYANQLYILMQFALREFIGTLTLDELLEKKDEIGNYILSNFKAKAGKLGVRLYSAGIRDIILPGEVKDIMNQVLVAQKRAQANIITRREETASTRSLLNTAKLMEDNAMLFKLKEMEYVEKIADKIGEITVSGSGNAIEQLKDIFTSGSSK